MADDKAPEFDPDELFKLIKSSRILQEIKNVDDLLITTVERLEEAKRSGQTALRDNLVFLLKSLMGEEKAIKAGFNTYFNKAMISEYIDKVKNRSVKLIELENFPRPIPKDCVDKIEKAKKLKAFTGFYVLFTDYTNKVGKMVKQEEKKKDPIVFGVFETDNFTVDRLYYICDWVDEHCDLTLSKLIDETTALKIERGPTRGESIETSLMEIRSQADAHIREHEAKKVRKTTVWSKLMHLFKGKDDE